MNWSDLKNEKKGPDCGKPHRPFVMSENRWLEHQLRSASRTASEGVFLPLTTSSSALP